MAKTTPMRNSKGRGLGRNDLIASYYTLSGAPVGDPARFSLEERVAAAAAAGFAAIGLAVEGELTLQANSQGPEPENHKQAEDCFHKAIDIARRQSAKSLELRAVMSLSRLWQHARGIATRERPTVWSDLFWSQFLAFF